MLALISELPVTITKHAEELESQEADSVCLSVDVSKDNVNVTWQKDGCDLGPSDKYEMTHRGRTHSLTIHDLTTDDEADYTAVAGSASTTIPVWVEGIVMVYL